MTAAADPGRLENDPARGLQPGQCTGGAGSSTSTSNEASSTFESSSFELCGDGQLQGNEECDGQEGCSDECIKEFRRVFITSEVFTGDLGGIAGADEKCRSAAENAGLPGAYMAWISSPEAEGSPAERFVRSLVPYRQVDGTVVASNWDDLADGTLMVGIFLTELGFPPQKGLTGSCNDVEGAFAWSNTRETGENWPDDDHCSGWSSMIGKGVVGWAGKTNSAWTMGCIANCADQAALYCVEQ